MLLKIRLQAYEQIDAIEVNVTSLRTDWCDWSYDCKLTNRLMSLKIKFTSIKIKIMWRHNFINKIMIDTQQVDDWQQVDWYNASDNIVC